MEEFNPSAFVSRRSPARAKMVQNAGLPLHDHAACVTPRIYGRPALPNTFSFGFAVGVVSLDSAFDISDLSGICFHVCRFHLYVRIVLP